jgi:3-phenylpropionate/cinnamic acid dioxygenase small subunit
MAESAVDRLADRVDIEELLHRYAWAMADRDWEAWRACFTDGGTADYSTAGGPSGPAGDAADWLGQTMAMFEVAASHVGNVVVDVVDDDAAKVRSLYKMVMKIAGEQPIFMEACGWYVDDVVRTAGGWRIAHRFEQLLYVR